MGRSVVEEAPKTIVILQWETHPQSSSPFLQFWTLDCRSSGPAASTLPLPAAVPDRLHGLSTELSRTNRSGSQVQLPPHLMYDSDSSSILMHDLVVGENVDVEFIRWGPGIHLAQVQAMEKLFARGPAGLSDARFLSSPGVICRDTRRDWDEVHPSSSVLLTAIALDNGNGTVDVKYRGRKLGRKSLYTSTIEEAYQYQEQTLRTFTTPGTSEAVSWPSPASNIPVYLNVVGRKIQYLLLATVGQNMDKSRTLLSLHMIEEGSAITEASSMKEPDQDRGLRWQSQIFELPTQDSSVAPLVIEIDHSTYLFVFYFHEGTLRYTRTRYAGSGVFEDSVNGIPCFAAATEEVRATAHARQTTLGSRLSLSSYFPSSLQEPSPTPRAERNPKKGPREPLPLIAEGCQPYALISNGFVWIFYRGADLKGKYVRHKVPKDIGSFSDNWEAASWTTAPHPEGSLGKGEDTSVSRHFIPVAVPGDFMCMQ